VKSEKANLLLNFLYSNPIVSSDEVVEKLNISPATANSLLRNLISL
jgi:predicted transcriptional regulator